MLLFLALLIYAFIFFSAIYYYEWNIEITIKNIVGIYTAHIYLFYNWLIIIAL
jgi:hypothetical protein